MGPRGIPRDSASVGLGIVGAGRWGRRIIATVDTLPDAEITAICSLTPPLGEGRERPWFPHWGDLIASGLCDGLIIASPPETHVSIALEALRAGLAVFIEKPLALSLSDATRLSVYAASRTAGPAILVDHTHLFAPAYQKLRSILRSPIAGIRTRGCSYEPSRPYSSLFDFGPHDLSMALDLLDTMPDRVDCRSAPRSRVTDGRDATDWLFEIQMRFGKVGVSCLVGNGADAKERLLEVICENGDRLVYDDRRELDKLRLNDAPIDVSPTKPLSVALSAFVRTVRGPRDPRCGLELPMKVQRVLEDCARVGHASGNSPNP